MFTIFEVSCIIFRTVSRDYSSMATTTGQVYYVLYCTINIVHIRY